MTRRVELGRASTSGKEVHLISNAGGDCVFSPLAGVQPHSLSRLASFKSIRAKKMKEREGRVYHSRPPCSRNAGVLEIKMFICIKVLLDGREKRILSP